MSKTDPLDMNMDEFKTSLDTKTTPTQVFDNVGRIYEYLTELYGTDAHDSVLREWTFQWYASKMGTDYNHIFQTWMNCDHAYVLDRS